MVDGEAWPVHGALEVLDALEASPVWRERGNGADGEGVGVALGYWPGATNAAAAACRVSPDGSVQVLTGVADMSGVAGGFQAIVGRDPRRGPRRRPDRDPRLQRRAGLARERRQHRHVLRRARDPRTRQKAPRSACSRRRRIELEIAVEDLELVDGAVRPRGTPGRSIPIAKLVRANARAGRPPIEAHGHAENPGLAPSVAGHVVRVRVDRDTGDVQVLADHVVQDVGRVLNPALVTGQQHGAAAQVVGWAVLEELVHGADGELRSGTFLDYALPQVDDVGELLTTNVEVPAPEGPLGAKGIGEAPVIPGAAAVANAVAAATGLRLRDLPMSRLRVWRALHGWLRCSVPARPRARPAARAWPPCRPTSSIAWLEARGEPAYRARQLEQAVWAGAANARRRPDDAAAAAGRPRSTKRSAGRPSRTRRSSVGRRADREGPPSTLGRPDDRVRADALPGPRRTEGAAHAVHLQPGRLRRRLPVLRDRRARLRARPRDRGDPRPGAERDRAPRRQTERHLTNVVFMGMGEPLLNLDRVLEAVAALNDPARLGLGAQATSRSRPRASCRASVG